MDNEHVRRSMVGAATQDAPAAIARALRILPPRYRQVFRLHVDAQMSYRAISRHLGISTKTVERDICGAREFCRHRLGVPGAQAGSG
jgi:RNA polymerase sigma factor (sigma-70 family)